VANPLVQPFRFFALISDKARSTVEAIRIPKVFGYRKCAMRKSAYVSDADDETGATLKRRQGRLGIVRSDTMTSTMTSTMKREEITRVAIFSHISHSVSPLSRDKANNKSTIHGKAGSPPSTEREREREREREGGREREREGERKGERESTQHAGRGC